ncbi:hypothetical protein Tco_0640260 [Tanacetum coccineum]
MHRYSLKGFLSKKVGYQASKKTKEKRLPKLAYAKTLRIVVRRAEDEPVRPGKNKRKKGRKLDSGNQVGQRFRESFQEERAAIRGIVPKEKEEEQRFRELFPKEGRPIDSGNQSREN